MDEFTDPNLKAIEEREQRRQRRRDRISRRKQRLEEAEEAMRTAAVAAAAEEARETQGRPSHSPTAEDGGHEVKPPRQHGEQPQAVGTAGRLFTSEPTPEGEEALNDARGLATIEQHQLATAKAPGALAEALPGDAFEVARIARETRMRQIRKELRRRRRLRTLGILLRFVIFVILPTAFVGWYYFEKATDMYVSKSAMIFKSGSAASPAGGLLGAFGGFSNLTDSVSVQEYILSKDILKRLQEEHDYIDHFKASTIDEFHRLEADANLDQAYGYYSGSWITSGKVEVSFDAAEGIIRLEVVGATGEAAQRFSQAIISYSEELVNSLNERSRNDGVRFAETKVNEAKDNLLAAQTRVADVQEQINIFSVEGEAAILQQRIAILEAEIDELLSRRAKLEASVRDQTDSRYTPIDQDLELKRGLLSDLRARLTGGDNATGPSMAQLSSQLELARVEQATANLLYSSALSSLETAIAAASSQSLYLETVVQPNLPENASKPDRLTNTGLVFLILFAAYILGLLTISLIREQAAI